MQFINKIRNPKNLSTFAQVAGCAALEDTQYMWNYVDEVHKGMAYFAEAMQTYASNLTVHPSHGNFMLIEFKSYEDKIILLNYLAEHNIFVRDTTQAPSVRNCFRITIGTREQMNQVVEVISHFYGRK